MIKDCYDMFKFYEGGRWVNIIPTIVISGKEIETDGFTVNKS